MTLASFSKELKMVFYTAQWQILSQSFLKKSDPQKEEEEEEKEVFVSAQCFTFYLNVNIVQLSGLGRLMQMNMKPTYETYTLLTEIPV